MAGTTKLETSHLVKSLQLIGKSRISVNEIYGYPIFKWVVTWRGWEGTMIVPTTSTRWHASFLTLVTIHPFVTRMTHTFVIVKVILTFAMYTGRTLAFVKVWKNNAIDPISQIPQCIWQVSNNAPFCDRNVHACAHFFYKMVHCGIWCTVGFVQQAY